MCIPFTNFWDTSKYWSKIANCSYRACIQRPSKVIPLEFCRDIWWEKKRKWWRYQVTEQNRFYLPNEVKIIGGSNVCKMVSRVDLHHDCDGQTDGRTNGQNSYSIYSGCTCIQCVAREKRLRISSMERTWALTIYCYRWLVYLHWRHFFGVSRHA